MTCPAQPLPIELVKLRASRMTAARVASRRKEARGHGETEQRLYALPVWRETLFFGARERAR